MDRYLAFIIFRTLFAVFAVGAVVFVSAVCIAVAWIGNAARRDPAEVAI